MKAVIGLTVVALFVSGCSCTTCKQPIAERIVIEEAANELEQEPVPGTVHDVWVEPMYDTVRVPAQLDPKGTYYRPTHRTVVEIRPNHFQVVEFPDSNDTGRRK